MNLHSLFWAIAFSLLCLLPSIAEQPNILVILADDMGAGDVQAINPQSRIPTPHLDRLAHEGITCLDAHSPSAVCTPTRYGLLTGRYCWRSSLKRGVLGGYSKPLIERERPTIGTFMQSAGYETGAVGKWHLGMELPTKTKGADTKRWDGDPGIDFAGVISDSPVHHGFDYFFGVSASLDMAPYVFIRNDRFTKLPSIQQPAVPFPHFVRQGPRADDFIIDEVLDRITQEAVDFIAKKRDKPFFLYVPFTAPHKPTQPHARFKNKTNLGEYGDFMVQTDWSVGQILKAVDQAGIAENTLVIFTSDNGSYMRLVDQGEPDHTSNPKLQEYDPDNHRPNGVYRGTKADVYEAGHRVPFFARWPGKISPSSEAKQTICHVDIFATCASVIGKPIPEGAAEDSHSLLNIFMDKENASRGGPVIHHSAAGMFAIRDGKWKLILGNGSGGREKPRGKPFEKPYQLYDMSQSASEDANVADIHPQIVEQLTAKFEAIHGAND